MLRIVKDAVNTIDLILNGNPNYPPFIIYYQDFDKTVDQMSHAIEFGRSQKPEDNGNINGGGLISSDDFENKIEIATYPRIDGKISSSGIYRTEGASCSLKVGRQYKNGIEPSERVRLDNQLYADLVLVQYDPRNLFIPADDDYNLPYDLRNYRITDISAVERDKLGCTIYQLRLEQVPVTDWQNSYMQIQFSRPQYANQQDQGQAKSRIL